MRTEATRDTGYRIYLLNGNGHPVRQSNLSNNFN